jgi:predicted nucleic acid-binding protein
MILFVDTSALIAVLDADDEFHTLAKTYWTEENCADTIWTTSNYVVLETFAVIQRRLGMQAVTVFLNDVLPIITIEWLDAAIHDAGVAALTTAQRRDLSLVDCISFTLMRHLDIRQVFTFDRHFAEQGFTCLP